MKNQKIKVALWAELEDNQSERLNGGNIGIYVCGKIGSIHYSGDKQTQVNVFSYDKAYGHYYHSVYTYYPSYGYYHNYKNC